MIRTLFLMTTILLAGCVQPAPDADEGPATPPTSTTPAANATFAAVVPEVTVEVDAVLTKAEVVNLFVNSTAPLEILVKQDGTERLRETAASATERPIPLAFGANTIEVTLTAPGFSETRTVTVVRLGMTTIKVDYGVFHPGAQGSPRAETFELWIDVDARPSSPAYAEQKIEHFDGFTAHDQLVAFEQTTGRKVEFEFFPSFQGFGVSRIDGAGSAVSSDAPPWWCYEINGGSADGISIQPVAPGDVTNWTLGSCT